LTILHGLAPPSKIVGNPTDAQGGTVEYEEEAHQLILALERLPPGRRESVKTASVLTQEEATTLRIALHEVAGPLRTVSLKLIDTWEAMSESERIASLLLLREILADRGLRVPGP